MSNVDPELLQEFVAECEEGREELDTLLLELEEGPPGTPEQASRIAAAFRAVHSIKGAAGFMESEVLERVAHAAENVLGGMRDGRLTAGPSHFAALFESCDALGTLIDDLAGQVDSDATLYLALVERLHELSPKPEDEASEDAPPEDEVASDPEPEAPGSEVQSEPDTAEPEATPEPDVVEPEAAPEVAKAPPPVAAPVPAEPATAAPSTPPAPAATPAKPAAKKKSTDKRRKTEETVRVDVSLLDDLMNLVGELVVCRNQILRVPVDRVDQELVDGIRRLDHLTSYIQERVMKTRMRPVGGAWGRLPRMVRDLANTVDKEIQLHMIGGDVELDRSILAAIKDPLAHMLRNAIDHGLETPDERVAAGKPRVGNLKLTAEHVGGQVHIEMSDDGRGLNTPAVREKAVSRGLLTPENAEQFSDEEVHGLIFEPGFSTAASVSRLSGRGVGMDVVRSNLTQIGGAVDVSSKQGQGTTFRLKIPLTLAILPALIVRCAGTHLAIPQAHLIELVDLRKQDIDTLADAPVLRRRGELLPLVYVHRELGLTDSERKEGDSEFVVVVQADENTYGLVVDSVEETEEIVVKPLGPELDEVDVFSGATVRGDGSIALIIDVLKLARIAQTARVVQQEPDDLNQQVETTPLLRFDVDGVGMGAVEVAKVVRIEDVPADTLQRHGDKYYLSWNNRILAVADLVDIEKIGGDPVSLVVCHREEHADQNSPGLVAVAVSQVLDVVDEPLEISIELPDGWATGMALIRGNTTAILDLDRLQRSVA